MLPRCMGGGFGANKAHGGTSKASEEGAYGQVSREQSERGAGRGGGGQRNLVGLALTRCTGRGGGGLALPRRTGRGGLL